MLSSDREANMRFFMIRCSLTAVLLQTDFIVTLVSVCIAMLFSLFFIGPILYLDEQLTFESAADKFVHFTNALLLIISWNCLITFLSNLYSENLKRREESTQLLNWIPSAVILQNFNKAKQAITFANKSSKRLLKQIQQMDQEMTWKDTMNKIFRKVLFDDKSG